jgi:hypothetical protein
MQLRAGSLGGREQLRIPPAISHPASKENLSDRVKPQ